jgi:hypothetical protein
VAEGGAGRLELSRRGGEVDVVLRVRPDVVRQAEEIVARVWGDLSPGSRAAAEPVRDAVTALCVVVLSHLEDAPAPDRRELPPALWAGVRELLAFRLPVSELPWGGESRAEQRARFVRRIREANAETLERLADL